jgi:hypothetical protein
MMRVENFIAGLQQDDIIGMLYREVALPTLRRDAARHTLSQSDYIAEVVHAMRGEHRQLHRVVTGAMLRATGIPIFFYCLLD